MLLHVQILIPLQSQKILIHQVMHFPARELGAADVGMPWHQWHWHLHHQPSPLHPRLPATPLALHYGPHCHPGKEVHIRLQVRLTLSTLSFRSSEEGGKDRRHGNWLGNVGFYTWDFQWKDILWRTIFVIRIKTFVWQSKTKGPIFHHRYSSTENLMEVESLQLLTLVMSIAHVVVLVQDSGTDPNLIRLLQTCEMMKPSSSSTPSSSSSSPSAPSGGDETQQYFPHVVFVHNRAPSHHFSPSTLKKLQVRIRPW